VRARRAAAAVCLLLARPLVADGGRAAEVAAWLTGTFELKNPGSGGAPEAVRIVIVAVPKSRIANGALVLYREQAAAPKLDEPSQQRFYRLEEEGNTVRVRAFDPKDPVLVRGKWRDPSALGLYGANDMRERPGCAMLFKKSGDLWEGETPGTGCPSIVKSATTMTSVLILAQDGFTQWDRGFDEKGQQTWKSPEGGMRFLKRSMNAPVDERLIERPVGRREADSKRR
jgi:CpeT protein